MNFMKMSGRVKGISLVLFLLFAAAGCSTSQKVSGETTYAGSSEEGTLLVNASGYGSNRQAALDNALHNAFRNLMFQGIPGSFQYLPLVGRNALETEHQHQAFFDAFFANKSYTQFIVSQDTGAFTGGKTDANLTARVKINVPALRSYLEQNKIIRKFGL